MVSTLTPSMAETLRREAITPQTTNEQTWLWGKDLNVKTNLDEPLWCNGRNESATLFPSELPREQRVR
jgi:hypothetical protein